MKITDEQRLAAKKASVDEKPRVPCRECKGSGTVVFTKEKGGPTCNNCAGAGYITPKMAQAVIASILDHPSIYMGGPSQQSLRKALRVVEYLQEQGLLPDEPA